MKPRFLIPAVPALALGLFLALLSPEAEQLADSNNARAEIGPDGGNGPPYEEAPLPGLTDEIGKVDFAVSQTMRRLDLPLESLRVEAAELREHNGYSYQARHVVITGVKDAPLFAQSLRDALIAWAEKAVLLREEATDNAATFKLRVSIDGVVTHYLSLLGGALAGPYAGGPQLVIVIDDLGESLSAARRLLALDFPVTFAVWPRSAHARALAEMANEHGLEVIIHQPMEPLGYPGVNPGRGVLLTGAEAEAMRSLLEENIGRVPYAVGLNNHMGSRLTQDEASMRLLALVLREHGLLALDSLTHPKSRLAGEALAAGCPAYRRDIFLDVTARKDMVLTQLRRAERLALVRGQAIAIGHPLAATLEALEEWGRTRDPRVEMTRLKNLPPLRRGVESRAQPAPGGLPYD